MQYISKHAIQYSKTSVTCGAGKDSLQYQYYSISMLYTATKKS